MNWKGFLQLNKWKVGLFIFILIGSFVLLRHTLANFPDGAPNSNAFTDILSIALFSVLFLAFYLGSIHPILGIVSAVPLLIIYWYLLASLIYFIFSDKSNTAWTSKRAQRVWNFIPERSKLILALILSVPGSTALISNNISYIIHPEGLFGYFAWLAYPIFLLGALFPIPTFILIILLLTLNYFIALAIISIYHKAKSLFINKNP